MGVIVYCRGSKSTPVKDYDDNGNIVSVVDNAVTNGDSTNDSVATDSNSATGNSGDNSSGNESGNECLPGKGRMNSFSFSFFILIFSVLIIRRMANIYPNKMSKYK